MPQHEPMLNLQVILMVRHILVLRHIDYFQYYEVDIYFLCKYFLSHPLQLSFID